MTVFSLVLLLAAPAPGLQSYERPAVPLAGLKYITISPVTTGDPRATRFELPAYLEQLLSAQGWAILTERDDLLRPEAREKASQTAVCVLDIDYSGWGTQALLKCDDIFGNPLFSAVDRAVAVSEEGELRAAVRNVAKAIQQERRQFDSRQTVDIVKRLPPVETRSLTETSLDELAAQGKLVAPIEGTWATASGVSYRVGIVADGADFVVVIFESPQTYLWQPGMVKARLTPAADGQTFVLNWRSSDRRKVPGYAVLKEGLLTAHVDLDGKDQALTFVKLRSATTSASPPSGSSEPLLSVTGTGFVCARGIVATNHHVVAGAKSVEFFLPVQKRSVKLQVLVSDPVNDIALLRAVDANTELPHALALARSLDVKLASDAYVVGFPLGDALGRDHKVTSGLVSGLEGLKGDPRELQLTASIQPGSSGSPVLGVDGRVIAIITSSLDSIAALRLAGQVPQNVNFALKVDYIALLLRNVSGMSAGMVSTVPPDDKHSVVDMVEAARASVGQIRVVR